MIEQERFDAAFKKVKHLPIYNPAFEQEIPYDLFITEFETITFDCMAMLQFRLWNIRYERDNL